MDVSNYDEMVKPQINQLIHFNVTHISFYKTLKIIVVGFRGLKNFHL